MQEDVKRRLAQVACHASAWVGGWGLSTFALCVVLVPLADGEAEAQKGAFLCAVFISTCVTLLAVGLYYKESIDAQHK
jgi:hypothetical protein